MQPPAGSLRWVKFRKWAVSEVGGANETTHDITFSSHVRAAIGKERGREGEMEEETKGGMDTGRERER